MSRFAVVPTTWLRDPALTPLDKLVLTLLASYADRNGYCWPGIRQLAGDCTVSERTLQYSLRRLQQAGAILVEPRQRTNGSLTSNAYWITGYDLPPKGGVVQPAAPGVVQPIAPPRCNPLHHQNSTSRTIPEGTEERGPDDDDTPGCQTLADTDKGEDGLRFVQHRVPAAEPPTFAAPTHQLAYEGFRRSARNGPILDMTLRGILDAGVAPEELGAALAEMAANGDRFNVALLRGYIRRYRLGTLRSEAGRGSVDAERVTGVWDRIAAALDDHDQPKEARHA